MSDKSLTKKSKKFYEKFPFPGIRPIDRDGLIFLRRFSQSIRNIPGKMDTKLCILDAGCGTGNTSISLASQFPDIEFLGLDNSKTSIMKAELEAEKRGLSNLHFQKWNLMDTIPFNKKFDIIFCLGVLHHTENMKRVLLNLNYSLKTKRQMYLWIYGKYGRYNHALNVRLLKMFLKADSNQSDKIKLAKEFLLHSKNFSPLNDLINSAGPDSMRQIILKNPVWIADQFLNPNEILIDFKKLIEISNSAGFEIEDVFGMNADISTYFSSQIILDLFKKFKKNQKLIALDLLQKPDRYFVCLRKIVNKRRIN